MLVKDKFELDYLVQLEINPKEAQRMKKERIASEKKKRDAREKREAKNLERLLKEQSISSVGYSPTKST